MTRAGARLRRQSLRRPGDLRTAERPGLARADRSEELRGATAPVRAAPEARDANKAPRNDVRDARADVR